MTVSQLIEELRGLDPLASVFLVAGSGGEAHKCGPDSVYEWQPTSDDRPVATIVRPSGLRPATREAFTRTGPVDCVVLYTEAGFHEARAAASKPAGAA